jgi:hypothetical protein
MEDELENWQRVQYRIDEEGIGYCFEGYSNWEEIKDEKFHELRLGFLKSMNDLREYVNNQVETLESK